MTIEQIARLYVIFKTLEPEIKEWIASDDTAAIVKAIAARFVLSDEQERKLPILVLRLVTQDLPPESFKAELAKELSVDESMAKDMTNAIAKDIVGPIAAALRYGGVDTNLLGFNAPATEKKQMPTEIKPIVSAPEPPTQQTPAPVAPKPPQPFILHEEPRVSVTPSAGRSFAYAPPLRPSGFPTPPVGYAGQNAGQAPSDGKVPARVVIERVVHYSELRTPLNVATMHKNALNPERAKPKTPQSKWFI